MSTPKAMTESEFEDMLKTSFKKLAKKDHEFQAILRDSQGQVSSSLSTSNVRNAVMACVSSDESVLSKIRECIVFSVRWYVISCKQKRNWRTSFQPNCWRMKVSFVTCAMSWWSRTGLERYEYVYILFHWHTSSRLNWENHAWFVAKMVTIQSVYTALTFPFLKKCQTCLRIVSMGLSMTPWLKVFQACPAIQSHGSQMPERHLKNLKLMSVLFPTYWLVCSSTMTLG